MFDKLVELLVTFIKVFQCCHIVDAYERGIVLRFGRYNRPAEPGLIWLIPFYVERVISTTVVPEPMAVGPQSLVSEDGKKLVVEAVFIVTISDPKTFMIDFEGGNAGLLLILRGALARFIESKKLSDLTQPEENEKSPSVLLAKAAQRVVRRYGAKIEDAQITQLIEARTYRLLGN